MKVAIMAGTPIDTEMGATLVRARGIETISYPISKTPEEQNEMQFLSREELFFLVCQKTEEAKRNGAAILFIYCNSLSSAIDVDSLRKITGIPIITPFDSYEEIAKRHSDIILLTANSIASNKVEKTLKRSNPKVEVLSIGYLKLVDYIERYQEKSQIITSGALFELFHFFNSLPENKNRIILLACTHFPSIKEELQGLSHYPILDPADTMLALLEKLAE